MSRKLLVAAAFGTALTCLPAQSASAAAKITNAAQLTAALKQAAPGTTLHLASGKFNGSWAIPPGVVLRGNGYKATVIDTGTTDTGITLTGDNSGLDDLSVVTGGGAAVVARRVKNIHFSGILVRGGAVALNCSDVNGILVENSIIDQSLTGLAFDRVTGAGVVNNTFTHDDTMAIELSDVSQSSVFNNAVVHAGFAVEVNQPGAGLAVDHNLYLAIYCGKRDSEAPRLNLGPWRDVSGGLDADSVQLPVVFRDAAGGDYTPVSTLDWNPGIATTANWGVSQLGAFKAPARDILGAERPALPGVGAVETDINRKARATTVLDGTFTVKSSAGTKSAGVFTPDGTAVRYLFRDLPLPAGTYGFVLPSRSDLGAPIANGQYELRLVESQLGIEFRKLVSNNGGTPVHEADPQSARRIIFGEEGSIIWMGGWSEMGDDAREVDIASHKPRWSLPGGAETLGLCRGADGTIYQLQNAPDNPVLVRFDNHGNILPWPGGVLKLPVPIKGANAVAELDGHIYISSDQGVDQVTVADGTLGHAFDALRPFGIVADRAHHLLWTVTGSNGFLGGTVAAFSPDGTQRATWTGAANPLGVAVDGNWLAVADYDSGQVRYLDITDPANPAQKKVLGSGDGPYGPVVPNRFWFQKSIYSHPAFVSLDLKADGSLAVLDRATRMLVFGPDGQNQLMSFAQFGNAPFWARFRGDNVSHFFDCNSEVSWTVDAKKGTWAPDAFWGRPDLNVHGNSTVGFFKYQDKVYGVMRYSPPGGKPARDGLLILRYDNYVGKIVAFYFYGDGGLRMVHDENGDNQISEADGPGTVLVRDDGQQVSNAMGRFANLEPDGSIRSEEGQHWVFKGLDDKGYPVYDFPAAPEAMANAKDLVSPYTFKGPTTPYSQSVIAPKGELITCMIPRDNPNGGQLSNSGAIDLARFHKDGSLRWYLPLNDYGPIQGANEVQPGFILTSWGHRAEFIGLDEDGLSLGHLGFPFEAHWSGYWLDHPDHYGLFQGNDGNLHIMAGDYSHPGAYWFSLRNYNNYTKSTFPFTVSANRAAALAAAPPVTTFMMPKSEKPHLTIPRLDQPLPIDGDLDKWRKLGISPQIVITPASSWAGISSAKEASSVVRVAYQGQDLYVQVLRFTQNPNFTQTIVTGTQCQDTVEMMINGFFPDGFQFSIGKFSTDGDQIVRRRFFANMTLNVPPDVAPRVIKVLDSAADVPERKLVEAATGEDLSDCKVIVTEFKLPIDARTWKGSENTLFPMEPGKGFWLGFMMDSNNVLGSDQQKTEVWPVDFNTFSDKQASCWVTLK